MVHCHGSSWFVMVHCHGSSWFVMVHCHGSSWLTVMVRHGLSWFTVMVSSWFVMVCDVLFSKILQKRSCDPLFSQSGSQIHYQISFLMRLLIFPFPLKSIPLKSSAKNKENRLDLRPLFLMSKVSKVHAIYWMHGIL